VHWNRIIQQSYQQRTIGCNDPNSLFVANFTNSPFQPFSPDPIRYVYGKTNDKYSAALNPDHTHFILVKSSEDEWGEEIVYVALSSLIGGLTMD
jgi:hypothetical protein